MITQIRRSLLTHTVFVTDSAGRTIGIAWGTNTPDAEIVEKITALPDLHGFIIVGDEESRMAAITDLKTIYKGV